MGFVIRFVKKPCLESVQVTITCRPHGMPPYTKRLQAKSAGVRNGNWRVVFRFEDGEAVDVNLIDYH